ncbi:hypothetical protein [Sphingomonas sp. Leaf4]|nr:hypothetical protein [Sphingomonas sp. Leaf4]
MVLLSAFSNWWILIARTLPERLIPKTVDNPPNDGPREAWRVLPD